MQFDKFIDAFISFQLAGVDVSNLMTYISLDTETFLIGFFILSKGNLKIEVEVEVFMISSCQTRIIPPQKIRYSSVRFQLLLLLIKLDWKCYKLLL